MMKNAVVSGSYDNINSIDVRFLQEAAAYGEVQVNLWDDDRARRITGREPKFLLPERQYFLQSLKYVDQVIPVEGEFSVDQISLVNGQKSDLWVVPEREDSSAKQVFCNDQEIMYQVIRRDALQGFPIPPEGEVHSPNAKKVLVSGCYDWFHSGHVRFFEETSALGDLYVVVGHDENVRLLKGEGHPMYSEDERRYMVGAVRFVKQALISSGNGWMDAEPEIERVKPDIYAVNEDGDKPEKRLFCEVHGLEYVVLKRTPAEGLPKRASTDLRGF